MSSTPSRYSGETHKDAPVAIDMVTLGRMGLDLIFLHVHNKKQMLANAGIHIRHNLGCGLLGAGNR